MTRRMLVLFLCSMALLLQPRDSRAELFGKKKEEKEAAMEEAEEEDQAKKDQVSRVIVLKWDSESSDHEDVNLQRNVKSALNRPEVLFFPSIDLYQDGRAIKHRTIPPELQPAIVPDENMDEILSSVDRVSGIPWDALTPNQWQLKAEELRNLSENIWFVDRVELREPLFLLYSQLGNAANNMNNNVSPFFERVGPITVNYYWYLAAVLAEQDPSLMSKLTDSDISGVIEQYLSDLRAGVFPTMKVDFQLENSFEKEVFDKTYEIRFNGLPMEVNDVGQIDIFLGRTDIYLVRKDTGHGIADRYEAVKTDEKAYTVLENAHKRMTLDFIRQLFLYESECKPMVEDYILTNLAIYSKLHPDVASRIYIAVPQYGNPNRVWVWRFDPDSTSLSKVADGVEEFPVHFVSTLGLGTVYNKATLSFKEDLGPVDAVDGVALDELVDPNTTKAYLPVYFDLRAHYNRFMVNGGIEFGYNLNESDDKWREYYQTPGKDGDEHDDIKTVHLSNCTPIYNDDGEVTSWEDCDVKEVYHEASFNRGLYIGGGYLFGKDASFGIGPRLALRFTFLNIPHSWSPSLNFGWTLPVPGIERLNKRVRLVLDVDLRAGGLISTHRSLYVDSRLSNFSDNGVGNNAPGAVVPVFGGVLGFGTTF
jgi:hypothetical protein